MHNRNEVISALQNGTVELLFEKSDGSSRLMKATLESSQLPLSTSSASERRDQDLITVWDTQAGAWRSLRLQRLLNWTPVAQPCSRMM